MLRAAAVIPLACLLLGARPYEDTQGRFSLSLPDRWRLAPDFGETRGMTFARPLDPRRGGGRVTLTVLVDVTEGAGPAAEWAALEGELSGRPGFAAVGRAQRRLGGHEAEVRRYRLEGEDGPTALTAHLVEHRGHVYRVVVAGHPRHRRRVASEVGRILRSFTPRAGASTAPDAPSGTAAPAGPPAFAGRWKSEAGLVLELGEDMRFALADVRGRYRVTGAGRLVLSMPKGEQSFDVQHDPRAGTLVLGSERLDRPIRYQRASEGGEGKSVSPGQLVGRWQLQSENGGRLALVLTPDGRFALGPHQGQWVVEDGELKLRKGPNQVIRYRVELHGNALTLSGADLDRPATFVRTK